MYISSVNNEAAKQKSLGNVIKSYACDLSLLSENVAISWLDSVWRTSLSTQ